MKHLAAAADARWEAKPRVMDAPEGATAQPLPALDTGGVRHEVAAGEARMEQQPRTSEAPAQQGKAEKDDPWAKARAQGPGETWQPTAWSPAPAKKR